MTFTSPHLLDSTRWAGMRIGLLGGSFNPPHAGHLYISLAALRGLQLDFVWWLVTPQNPLKPVAGMMAYDERLKLSRELVRHPRVLITDLERQLGVNRSYETIRGLKKHFPRTEFVWLTGMDNAMSFHRWYRWRDILAEVATAHLARPPAAGLMSGCPLRQTEGSQRHYFPAAGERVRLAPHHSYWLLQGKLLDVSSTTIRNSPIKTKH